MPDASLPEINPAEQAGILIREMIRGDLLLRWNSLAELGKGSLAPSILFSRQLRGKLSVALSVSKKKKFFFFFKTHSDTQRIADIRVRFALAPSMEIHTRLASALTTELEPPAYLIDSGNGGQLQLGFSNNRPIAIQFHVDNDFTVHRPGDRPYRKDELWPLSLSIAIIDGIADQSRDNETGSPRPFIVPDDEILSRVMKKVVLSYRDIISTLGGLFDDETISELDKRLREKHPDLGGNYRFNELFSRVLVRIGENGKLSVDGKNAEVHQLDVEARLITVGENYALRYRFRIPDLLASGEFHRSFLQSVRNSRPADDFCNKCNAVIGEKWSSEEFRAFLLHFNQDRCALFIRTGRHIGQKKKDRNLVLLRGPLAGRDTELLFEAEFQVEPYPRVTVNKIEVKDLVGFRLGDGSWQWGKSTPEFSESLPQLYVGGLLGTLRGWQKGMARAGSSPAYPSP